MNFICKYCGHPCLTFSLSEQAHICQNCSTKLQKGIELDTDLFWNQEEDEEYFKHLDKECNS